MKKKMLGLILGAAVFALAGCGGSGDTGAAEAAASTEETAPEAEEAATEEAQAAAEEDIPLTDEDNSDYPEDFVQNQSGVLKFKDYDEIISYLKPGQGYAYVKLDGAADDVLLITEQVFEADKTAGEASVYGIRDGVPMFMGVVTGNGSAYPIRYADGKLYGGDNHRIDTFFLVPDSMTTMQKDYVDDGVNDGSNQFSGFLRKEPVFDKDEDFTGGQKEFDALIAEREAVPAVTFTIVDGDASAAEGSITPPAVKALETYASVLSGLPEDSCYGLADLSDNYDALLVTKKESTYDDGEGNRLAGEATVYGLDKDGKPVELGTIASGGTAYPISVYEKKLITGNHRQVMTSYIDEAKSELVTDTDESEAAFDIWEKATEVVFFSVPGEGTQGSEASTADGKLPPYEYPGPEQFYYVVYKYVIDEFGKGYEKSDVSIPCILEAYVDESNKDDILFYGDFWVFNYDLEGDTLMNKSGGSYPGVMHLKNTEDGYAVTKVDVVEDGSRWDKSAKEIFGKHYDECMKLISDDKLREQTRAQIIANYVAANNLSITQYKDYGWDPVKLPEQNIDSFYSDLD